jgi:ABC-type lipoprotein export system ATPase subunit
VNLLTVDEVVSSIDTETSAYVISYLKNFAEENNLNVFIVSHTELPLDMFDKIIQVEKINGFSRFEVNKTVA